MTWNIASAKQQFSEVVRLTAEEPQAIYNRDKPVAVLISAQEYEEFKAWQAQKNRPTLAEQFDEIRALLAAGGVGVGKAGCTGGAISSTRGLGSAVTGRAAGGILSAVSACFWPVLYLCSSLRCKEPFSVVF